ncbi:PstS family phosphate ABC transporter substrate-binding protein [Alienimonas californiensis]|uniref:Phosphate-binding protein n=1 Tax=Alienimonas californiensis TaxID=2527989 RepID=A0A517PBQ7_9PLAN|nr:PstS family phosphate ABC transporter substrate-binding protein [Alienimonas californiensis]QDT16813.1 Phosphate-binding protein PstS precursor [Alienimonas californiensis]
MSRPPLRVLLALSLVTLTAFGCSSETDALDGVSGAPEAVVAPVESGSDPSAAETAAFKPAGDAVPVDAALPTYERGAAVSGTVISKGSDTMRAVMDYWAEGFSGFYPGVDFEIESKGSSSAPTALIEGSALIGVMSRPMKESEIQDFEKKYGYPPTEIRTSRDLLAVFVNKDNPVEGLTLPEVDAIFSANRNLGLTEKIERWSQVGVDGPLADRPISLYGRNSASGTYGYFKEVALGDGDFSNAVKEQSGTSGAIQAVSDDKAGIAYSGIGGTTAGVRALPLAAEDGGEYFEPTVENADTGDYPLARFLLIYVNKKPDAPLEPLPTEFLKYVFSKQGQQRVVQAGYFPVSAKEAAAQLENAGIPVASASSEDADN